MKTNIIFKDEKIVDIVLTINLDTLEKVILAKKQRLEGRNRRGRPFTLNARQIVEIKNLLAQGEKQIALANKYGVSQATISRINTNNVTGQISYATH
ncbi:hypothetical protein [Cycloclasticus pugetii]|uniref:hypothetical protein n=1 Tax=Cycloclasticus pugetii TaxID=34068 RepID=UPI003A8F7FEB